jgi:hypothetical protein
MLHTKKRARTESFQFGALLPSTIRPSLQKGLGASVVLLLSLKPREVARVERIRMTIRRGRRVAWALTGRPFSSLRSCLPQGCWGARIYACRSSSSVVLTPPSCGGLASRAHWARTAPRRALRVVEDGRWPYREADMHQGCRQCARRDMEKCNGRTLSHGRHAIACNLGRVHTCMMGKRERIRSWVNGEGGKYA